VTAVREEAPPAPLVGEGVLLAPRSHKRARRRGALGNWRSLTASGLAILFALLVWEVMSAKHVVATYSLPTPHSVWTEWWALSRRGILWHHVWVTVHVALFGWAFAFVVAFVFSYPLSRSPLFASFLAPYIAGTQAMPILALAPLLTVWFGLGLFSKMLICAVICFFPMMVTFSVALQNVDRTLIDAAATEGAGRWTSLRYIELPLATRTILAGVRMGLTLSMTGAIVSEFVAASAGLGYMMELGRNQYDAPLVFAAALTLIGIAVFFYVVVGLLERVLIDWE
jgi:NitT/TauT family transport system permease protein